ncbi:MAG: phosphatase PAP2 family protein [Thermodesulfobacteriota bacterium]
MGAVGPGRPWCARPPSHLPHVTLATPAFPSAHAAGAAAVYGFLAFLVARDLKQARARFEVAYWTAVGVLLVGSSRVLLGVHYVTDVLAGLLVGALWIVVGVVWAGAQSAGRKSQGR